MIVVEFLVDLFFIYVDYIDDGIGFGLDGRFFDQFLEDLWVVGVLGVFEVDYGGGGIVYWFIVNGCCFGLVGW